MLLLLIPYAERPCLTYAEKESLKRRERGFCSDGWERERERSWCFNLKEEETTIIYVLVFSNHFFSLKIYNCVWIININQILMIKEKGPLFCRMKYNVSAIAVRSFRVSCNLLWCPSKLVQKSNCFLLLNMDTFNF